MLRLCQEGPLIGTPGRGTERHLPQLPEAEQSRAEVDAVPITSASAWLPHSSGDFPAVPWEKLAVPGEQCVLAPARAHTAI